MVRCTNGHYYDNEKYRDCPYCGVKNPDLQKTVAKFADEQIKKNNSQSEVMTVAKSVKVTGGTDPVVGWLVCVEGFDKGTDFRLHSDRNFIGRSSEMDVAILRDSSISRVNHAVVSFNPQKNSFKINSGEVRGLVLLNSEEVFSPRELKAHDIIELGDTKLLFVPLCDETFSWEKKDEFTE